mmetsp:Transcript_23022/g.23287  ORF Transcript_23022/g.23287 Transcript_23022/m.23287 type:complete len:137 (-) Transcript_23022:311-721(-)
MKLSLSALSSVVVFSSLIRTGTAGHHSPSGCHSFKFKCTIFPKKHEKCLTQFDNCRKSTSQCKEKKKKCFNKVLKWISGEQEEMSSAVRYLSERRIGLELELVELEEELEDGDGDEDEDAVGNEDENKDVVPSERD